MSTIVKFATCGRWMPLHWETMPRCKECGTSRVFRIWSAFIVWWRKVVR